MITSVLRGVQELEGLSKEWWELYRACPRSTPFQSPVWVLEWLKRLYRGGDILAVTMRDGQQLIGLVPLFCWGVGHRTVSFLGAGISDYGDMIYRPGREADCLEALRNFLRVHRNEWDSLDLQELRSDSALLATGEPRSCAVCPVLDLDSYPESMDPKHRIDLRRAKNKLSKSHHQELVVADVTNLSTCMNQFADLYESRWGTFEPSLRGFHEAVAEGFLAAGMLRLSVLRIDGKPAAAVYAFATGSVLYCYLSGFDRAIAKLSPGAVVLEQAIENARAEGKKEIDFLRHPESYKYLWGARDRQNYKITGVVIETMDGGLPEPVCLP